MRHSLFWNAVTWQRTPAKKEFHLGPIFSIHTNSERRRVALGNGVVGMQRQTDGRWRFFLFDFRSKDATKADQATLP
jgi:hypothetical protein